MNSFEKQSANELWSATHAKDNSGRYHPEARPAGMSQGAYDAIYYQFWVQEDNPVGYRGVNADKGTLQEYWFCVAAGDYAMTDAEYYERYGEPE